MIIAGLGNPGKEYENTRHNAGFWAADSIAEKFRVTFQQSKHRAMTGEINLHGCTHYLMKPLTFMNLSGEAIAGTMIEKDVPPSDLLVIIDDINLPLGRIRLRSSGSDGGHNGLKSIISHIGRNFWRLRIGVGVPQTKISDPHSTLVNHVLGSITDEEQKIFKRLLDSMPDIAATWLLGMGNKAMTKYNGFDFSTDETPE